MANVDCVNRYIPDLVAILFSVPFSSVIVLAISHCICFILEDMDAAQLKILFSSANLLPYIMTVYQERQVALAASDGGVGSPPSTSPVNGSGPLLSGISSDAKSPKKSIRDRFHLPQLRHRRSSHLRNIRKSEKKRRPSSTCTTPSPSPSPSSSPSPQAKIMSQSPRAPSVLTRNYEAGRLENRTDYAFLRPVLIQIVAAISQCEGYEEYLPASFPLAAWKEIAEAIENDHEDALAIPYTQPSRKILRSKRRLDLASLAKAQFNDLT